MSLRVFEPKVACAVIGLLGVLLVILCHSLGMLEWSVPAMAFVTAAVIFFTTENGKRVWHTPGHRHVVWSLVLIGIVTGALFILLPDDRFQPTVEQVVANFSFYCWEFLLVLFLMIGGYGAAGWQMWTTSRKLDAPSDRILAGCAAFVTWGVMLFVSVAWLSHDGRVLVHAINQVMN